MVVYVRLEVQIHGLGRRPGGVLSVAEVLRRTREALVKEFDLDHENDVDVTIIESAGKELDDA